MTEQENRYQATVIWKDNCIKCKITMERLKLPFKPVKLSSDIIDWLKNEKEVRTMPFVQVYDLKKDEIVDEWSNLRPDKITEWNRKAKE
ncbi:hypothetical protein [Liquorilactobacillus mali]|nr:hypothetical protein [Liquorilactobacillus mali]